MGWFVLASLLDFNSRPHGGRLPHPAPLPGASGFQLTPSRRATWRTSFRLRTRELFQLTPSRRATVFLYHVLRHGEYFNSRPHGGRRTTNAGAVGTIISTHALTEGDATKVLFRSLYAFQLTPSRRATIFRMTMREHTGNFNSRPHGGRPSFHSFSHSARAFQLTPSRRATAVLLRTRPLISFQLTPSRRATLALYPLLPGHDISTHALTEGDGKFRQIFLLNRGYAYSISLYFLPHFISLLPQILSFQQKSFKFQVRIFLLFSVHLAFALQNQCVHHVKYRFCTNMFYFVFVLFTQIVKPQTIGLFIYDFF